MHPKTIALTTLLTLLISTPRLQAKPIAKPIPITLQSSNTRESFQPKDRTKSQKPYSDKDRIIIGTDDRTPILTRAYPWSAIGRIEISTATEGYTCTGTLIGLDIVLTNAHCLMDEQTKQPMIPKNASPDNPAQIKFSPSMIRGTALDTARVIDYRYGTKDPYTNPGDDWAILKLDQPLGARYGYLGWRNLNFANPKIRQATRDRLTLVGYARDFPTARNTEYGTGGETAGMNQTCSIEGLVAQKGLKGVLLHRCDSNPGTSGGPIFAQFSNGNYYIVGLHSGSVDLNQWQMLSNGDISKTVNRGVAVSQWGTAAFYMK
ncbi:trypsin-like serine peptidase [Altericista sp. CCNU0014]|uniref:trypsin-like serine peptidase n=1 Tax=Altericista sp. CCNU0014 TaxID=3082949 RepID=UPI00384D726D